MMNLIQRFSCFGAFTLAIVFLCAHALAGEPVRKPNVLFVSFDDLNDWVGCMGGHPNAQTPNLDRLAKQGTLFRNAHCNSPLCGPSRAAILTGIATHRTGMYGMVSQTKIKKASPLLTNLPFLPEHFQQHGYTTLGVGKIFHQTTTAGGFDEYGGKASPLPDPTVTRWTSDKTQTDWGATDRATEQMPDYQIAQSAIKSINRKHDKPFFLAVGFNKPHVPWGIPQKWLDLHPLNGIKTPPYKPDDMDDIPEMGKKVSARPEMPTTEWATEKSEWKAIVQAYLACTTFADHCLGMVLDALAKSPHAKNTIIVVWSDHGYHLGEKNRFAKHALWYRNTHVPLIIVGVNPKAAQVCDRAVGLIDLYPTLIELCGLPAVKGLDGRSLAPLLADPAAKWDGPVLTTWGRGNHSLIDEKHQYIRYSDGSEELYDLKADPNEWTNLAAKPESAATLADFRKLVPQHDAPLAPGSTSAANQ